MTVLKGFSEPRPELISPVQSTPPTPVRTTIINDFDLTPDTLKQQHAEAIGKFNTFETFGVSESAALNYLETPAGMTPAEKSRHP